MTLNRRGFLQLSGAALAAALLPAGLRAAQAAAVPTRGFYFPGYMLPDRDATLAFQDTVLRAGANAIVMDVKNEGGNVHVPFEHPLKPARKQSYAYPNQLGALLGWCLSNGIRPVARQVVFQDAWLTSFRPSLALLDEAGGIWRGQDGQGIPYADPFSEQVHDYNAAIAEAAARLGFPEVQFDYVRFPTGSMKGINFSKAWTFENRTAAIAQFLAAAAPRVRAAGAIAAADVFGVSVLPELSDSGIGQHIETMAPYLDVLCPMGYPSTFGGGISSCPDRCIPAPAHSLEVAYHTTRLALARAQSVAPAIKIVPWIQVFADYRYSLPFGLEEYWDQQRGAYAAGAAGVYCWRYSGDYPVDTFLPLGPSKPNVPSPTQDRKR